RCAVEAGGGVAGEERGEGCAGDGDSGGAERGAACEAGGRSFGVRSSLRSLQIRFHRHREHRGGSSRAFLCIAHDETLCKPRRLLPEPPFQGLGRIAGIEPRALPWAPARWRRWRRDQTSLTIVSYL